ncbi:MAG: hypothetical protein JW751_04870 [Polyangiaceae bacterium]|nr:hypothetical protein [Polyangiaceae bacterium]
MDPGALRGFPSVAGALWLAGCGGRVESTSDGISSGGSASGGSPAECDPGTTGSEGEVTAEHGFSFHAATTAGANDRAGKAALSQVHPPPAPRPGPRDARRR